ncbi:MAG: SRPBCC family protein [Nocardioides sp.]
MSTDTGTSIQATTTVDLPADEAFTLFTDDIGTWWNADHHIIEAPLSHMVFDPFVGGNLYDVGTDGSECRWARVLVYDRPHEVVFSWDINAQWQIETDPAKCSEVRVTFTEDPPGRTTVVLEHRHLERHGDEIVSQVEGMRSGWQEGLIDKYAEAAAQR